jgi:O-antigen/teichoic acid export membrane protein
MSEGERQKLMRDAAINNLSMIVSAIVGILLVPAMLKALGQDTYGLWIIATSISGILAAIDFGLYRSISRVVAVDPEGKDKESADFVKSASNVYSLIGLGGWIILGGAGWLSGNKLNLPPVDRHTVAIVFWLIGAALFADRVSAFGLGVLAGLRRYDLINITSGVTAITWATGVVIILIKSGSVISIAWYQLSVAVLRSIVILRLIARLSPNFGFRPGFLRVSALRRHLSFAASSMLMTILSSLTWQSATVLIGFIRGSAAAVPFYVGQKLPLAVSGITWSAAEVLFPAVSKNQNDLIKSRDILRTGSRWIMVLTLPFAVLLFISAPSLLHAWLGNPPPGAIGVMRILAATVLADAIMAAPLYLLWGRGAMRPALITSIAQAVGVVVLISVLVHPLGVTGAAWGMMIPMSAAAAVLFVRASRICAIKTWKLAADIWRGLALPLVACVLITSSLLFLGNDGRVWVATTLVLGGLSYLVVLLGIGGNSEERLFAGDIYRRVRSAWAGLLFLRSAWNSARERLDLALNKWRKRS